MKRGLVRQAARSIETSYSLATLGLAPLFVADGVVPRVVWRIELVGESGAVGSGAPATPTPMSQFTTGFASPAAPMPVTVPTPRVPARLSQKMLLNKTGLL